MLQQPTKAKKPTVNFNEVQETMHLEKILAAIGQSDHNKFPVGLKRPAAKIYNNRVVLTVKTKVTEI